MAALKMMALCLSKVRRLGDVVEEVRESGCN